MIKISDNKNSNFNIFLFVCLEVIVGLEVYILNYHTGLFADDYAYSFVWHSNLSLRCESLSDVLYSQYLHYFSWGGRSVAHFLAQTFLLFDGRVFDVCNTMMFIILVNVIYLHITGIKGVKDIRSFTFLYVIFMLFVFVPSFGESFLWLVGSCNYLWCPTIGLSFLLLYRLQYEKESSVVGSPLLYILIFHAGILAGWSNENLCLSMIVMECLYILMYRKMNGKFYAWTIVGLLGTILGAILLLGAPGNYIRLESAGKAHNIFLRTILVLDTALDKDFLLLPLVAMIVGFYWDKINSRLILIYGVGAFVATFAMAAAPEFPDRVKVISIIIFTILVGFLIGQPERKSHVCTILLASVLVLGLLSSFKLAYFSTKEIKAYQDKVLEIVESSKKVGKDNVVLPDYSGYSRFSLCRQGRMFYGIEHINNRSFSRYHHIESIRVGLCANE